MSPPPRPVGLGVVGISPPPRPEDDAWRRELDPEVDPVEGASGKRPERALGLDRVRCGVVVRNRRVRVEGRRRVNMVEVGGMCGCVCGGGEVDGVDVMWCFRHLYEWVVLRRRVDELDQELVVVVRVLQRCVV